MKKKYIIIICIFQIYGISPLWAETVDISNLTSDWNAGVAKGVITPEGSMWMAGYSARDRPSEGKLHDLWAKALVVEDAGGKRAVFISTDLLGIPKAMSDRIRERLQEINNLFKAEIVLNSSHTHTGPALYNPDRQNSFSANERKKIMGYSKKVEDKIVALVGEAINSMEPVQLYAENGVTRFQVNRRNNNESLLEQQTELQGPNDYAVPVIKVVNETGELLAVAFGYACHPTVLSGYEWSGDYAGFAQLELEKMYPGVTALFFQGAGGDQNPLPRRSIALAQQYGKTLAAAVERVLNEDMRRLSPRLSTAYSEVDLPLTTPPTKEELSKIATANNSSDSKKGWATALLNRLEEGESLMTSYPYPVQVLQLGSQIIVTLGGELVVEYAIELKRLFGKETFVLGYSNDSNMAYIPTGRILLEGGYEGATSHVVKGLPGPWASNIETVIFTEVLKLAGQVGIGIE